MIRPVGQAVKTPPFHGGNSSSILLRVTKKTREFHSLVFLFVDSCPEAYLAIGASIANRIWNPESCRMVLSGIFVS